MTVQSRRDTQSYTVTFWLTEDALHVSCTCRVHPKDPMCTHILSLLIYDYKILVNPIDKESLKPVYAWAEERQVYNMGEQLKNCEGTVVRITKNSS